MYIFYQAWYIASNLRIDWFYIAHYFLCIGPRKKLFTGDISSRIDFPMSVLNESWRSSRRRHYNNAFLAPLSSARWGERFRTATCCCDKNRPDGSLAGGLVLVPIDLANYSQTWRYREWFLWTLFSLTDCSRSSFYETRCTRRNKNLRLSD